jgi:RHS repeat-associated protein
VAGSQEEWQVYGFDGELLAEYPASMPASAPEKEYGYRNGQLLVIATLDTVWSDDAVPAGAVATGDNESWNWVSSNPGPFSGATAHQSNIFAGLHQHYFYGATATLSVGAGDKLFAYVYLDPSNMPSQIMLQWAETGTWWEHRAYWGANNIPWGVDGTNSRRYMGPLPAAGGWVRLEVPASLVGLEGYTVHGLAFSMWGGRATWDRAGKTKAGSSLQWLVTDHLGTPRMIVDETGSLANVKRHDYLPFGEELYAGTGGRTTSLGYTGSDGVRQQFTQKERDVETGLDYFGARYLASTQGRFTSADPIFTTLERLIDPQRLNLYSYTKNNPLRFTDGNGKDLAIDAKTEEEARKKYELFQKGLTKDDRSHTHFFVGNGKDGYQKGTFYVQIDKDYKSGSDNFVAVQTIANDRGGTAMITLQRGGVNIPEVIAVKDGNKIVLEDPSKHFGETLLNTLGPQTEGDTRYGMTMFPIPKHPIERQIYGTSKNIEVYVWNEQSDVEIVAAMYHELRAHVYLSNMGRDIERGSHGSPGVNDAAKAAEAEAKKNFNQ